MEGGRFVKRVAGFALFFTGVGILIGIWLPNLFVEVLCIILCLLAAYELFFCCGDDK